jgi:hypothetical protein
MSAAFDTAAFEGLAAAEAITAAEVAAAAEAAAATAAATSAASTTAANVFDPYAFEGFGQYMAQAPVNPVTQAFNTGNMANLTGNAPNAFQGITELNAPQTADLMRNIDPRMVDTLQPVADTTVPNVTSRSLPIEGGQNAGQLQVDLNNRVGNNIYKPIGADFEQMPANMPAYSALNAPLSTSPTALQNISSFAKEYKTPLTMAGSSLGLRALMNADSRKYGVPGTEKYTGPLSKFSYNPNNYRPDITTPPANPYRAQYAAGGPVEQMSNQAAMGANTMYPMANMSTSAFATPYQNPVSTNMLAPTSDTPVGMSGEPNMQGTRMAEGGITRLATGGFFKNVLGDAAQLVGDIGGGAVNLVGNLGQGRLSLARPDHGGDYQPYDDYSKNSYTYDPNKYKTYTAPNPNTYQAQYAGGGIASLGSYSDGGRMLKGPGDGMSDSIPAKIGAKQEARLADGEFVVPADVVSHLGNGSTDAGAKQLYSMMDKVRQARTGRKDQGRQIKPNKYMPT